LILIPSEEKGILGFASFCCFAELLYLSMSSECIYITNYASLQLVGAKGASAVVKGGLKQAAKSEEATAVKKAAVTGTKHAKTKVQAGYQSLTQQRLNYEVAGIGNVNLPSVQHVEILDAKNQMYQVAPYTYTDLHTGEEKTVSLHMGHKKMMFIQEQVFLTIAMVFQFLILNFKLILIHQFI
jgi:hypothetical protein